ncbi:beta-ketoacyl-ACP synthase [Cupriavidus sp. 2SB]|uniref:beta-ketoacyl-ACP synthase n=1 Tax=Cupriavidus sp. 2SB TaxID=2502199 RepID=UPI0010F727E7|nr:beta-ketoacyl-ACP synthase [Cupriavidus sp. 2SB]
MTIYLNAMNVICALGSGNDAVRTALWRTDGPSGGETTDRYTPGTPLHLGTVREVVTAADLPADVAPARRSRNNALLHHTLAAIRPAVEAAIARVGPTRVAIVLGTSTSGIGDGEVAVRERQRTGQWPKAFHYGQQELGSPAQYLALALGVAGPAYTISTACSSSAKALGAAGRLLEQGMADVVIAGGVDTLCAFTIAGFRSLESVSAERCNPMSAHRNGINLGEGAALFLMSREAGPVRLAGWGETSDAHHMSAPDPKGFGARTAMAQALDRAGLQAADIDYLNLHGTATEQNDAMESRAVMDLLGPDVPVSSTKPQTGHALGAAGAVEAALMVLTLTGNPRGRLPAHWWDGTPDAALPALHVVDADESLGRPVRHVMSNSFAFGGSNCVLVLGEG